MKAVRWHRFTSSNIKSATTVLFSFQFYTFYTKGSFFFFFFNDWITSDFRFQIRLRDRNRDNFSLHLLDTIFSTIHIGYSLKFKMIIYFFHENTIIRGKKFQKEIRVTNILESFWSVNVFRNFFSNKKYFKNKLMSVTI